MADDIRYSELRFLESLSSGTGSGFNHQDQKWLEVLDLSQRLFIEMVVALIEDLYVKLDEQDSDLLVSRLRREVGRISGLW